MLDFSCFALVNRTHLYQVVYRFDLFRVNLTCHHDVVLLVLFVLFSTEAKFCVVDFLTLNVSRIFSMIGITSSLRPNIRPSKFVAILLIGLLFSSLSENNVGRSQLSV